MLSLVTIFFFNLQEKREEKSDSNDFTFGTAGELRLDSNRKPVLVDVDKEELAHPSVSTQSHLVSVVVVLCYSSLINHQFESKI